jgi:putative oxidoreductase
MELGLFVIRAVIGLLFAGHGAQKLFGWFGGHGPGGTGRFFESLGLRPGREMALIAGAGEITGGLLLATGLLTPLAAAILMAVMFTAGWTAHRPKGLWITEGGYEYTLVLAAAVFAVATGGPGEWSLDAALAIDWAGPGWALAALAVAVAVAAASIAAGRSGVLVPSDRDRRARTRGPHPVGS